MSSTPPQKPLTGAFRTDGRPLGLEDYRRRAAGYQGLQKALQMAPAEVTGIVKQANLRGRGGAGFPAGVKWEFMPPRDQARRPRYLVCNGDEMEPGAFKDRWLMEASPHQLLEGMIIAAYALQADHAYIFLRWAYHRAARRLRAAIEEAYGAGLLGRNILGSSFTLDLHLHRSAGRYICGEETALLNALEGKRPIPREKPPHTQHCGLWGKPTVINNVETLCNVHHIINYGAEWYQGLGRGNDSGTKIYGVSGRVRRPGAWELPMGTSMRELVEVHAGGLQEGLTCRAVIPGGASTEFVLAKDLDTPMDFDAVPKVGSRMGTGTMIVLDDRTCPVGAVHNLIQFFARESCGWCTPCREGLPWLERILHDLEHGQGEPGDLELLEEHTRLLAPKHTFCLLAPGAMEPLQSALKYFRADFERHVTEKRCPWKNQQK